MKSTTNFYLRNKTATKETPIVLYVRYEGRQIKIPTGLKVIPKYWNQKKQVVRITHEHCVSMNHNLGEIEKQAQLICIEETYLTNEKFKNTLDIAVNGEPIQEVNKNLLDFMDKFIEFSKVSKKKSTIVSYGTVRKRIQGFQDFRKKTITFDCVDIEFYEDLQEYLFGVRKLSNNSFGATVKVLKTVLNDATEKDLNTNLNFRKSRFKAIQEETDNIYLSEEEIQTLLDLDLNQEPHLERVRDLFVVGCYTGLRFSDFSNIQTEHIKDDCIYIKTQKTKQDVVVPIHGIVRNILQKYDGRLPKALVNQVMNRYLKEIGMKAGFDEMEIIEKTKAGKRNTIQTPRYEMIATHTARRSFATNAYKAEIPTIAIMKITGHKTEKSFLKYIKISEEENAQKLLNHPFFKRSHLKAV